MHERSLEQYRTLNVEELNEEISLKYFDNDSFVLDSFFLQKIMSYQQPPTSSNNNLPPFGKNDQTRNRRVFSCLDWSLPGRNMGGGPPPLMGLPNRVCLIADSCLIIVF